MPESWWGNAIFSLVPTIVLGLIFWMVLRMIIRGDRTARREYDRIEAEERAKLGLPPKGAATTAAPAATEAPAAAPAGTAAPAAAPTATAPQRPEDPDGAAASSG